MQSGGHAYDRCLASFLEDRHADRLRDAQSGGVEMIASSLTTLSPRLALPVWAVFREGSYRHECGGIFTVQARAIECAKALAEADADDHHEYEVIPFVIDTPGELSRSARYRGPSPLIVESEPVFICRKARSGSADRIVVRKGGDQ
jgi:hypothetical protein